MADTGSSHPIEGTKSAPMWGTKPEHIADCLDSLQNLVDFAYEHGYHEHGVPLVQIVREGLHARQEALKQIVNVAEAPHPDNERRWRVAGIARAAIAGTGSLPSVQRVSPEEAEWLIVQFENAAEYLRLSIVRDVDADEIDRNEARWKQARASLKSALLGPETKRGNE